MAKKRNQIKKREWFNFNKAIALLLILALFIILKTAFTPPKATANLAQEAKIVLSTLTNEYAEISLVDSNGLIEEKIKNLDQMDYDEIKNILGVENDFCIFFEDVSGNLVKIDDINAGIGSDKIYINGNPCE